METYPNLFVGFIIDSDTVQISRVMFLLLILLNAGALNFCLKSKKHILSGLCGFRCWWRRKQSLTSIINLLLDYVSYPFMVIKCSFFHVPPSNDLIPVVPSYKPTPTVTTSILFFFFPVTLASDI